MRVIPGVLPILGSTEAEARARRDELATLVSDEYAREILADRIEVSLDTVDLDAPLPDAYGTTWPASAVAADNSRRWPRWRAGTTLLSDSWRPGKPRSGRA